MNLVDLGGEVGGGVVERLEFWNLRSGLLLNHYLRTPLAATPHHLRTHLCLLQLPNNVAILNLIREIIWLIFND